MGISFQLLLDKLQGLLESVLVGLRPPPLSLVLGHEGGEIFMLAVCELIDVSVHIDDRPLSLLRFIGGRSGRASVGPAAGRVDRIRASRGSGRRVGIDSPPVFGSLRLGDGVSVLVGGFGRGPRNAVDRLILGTNEADAGELFLSFLPPPLYLVAGHHSDPGITRSVPVDFGDYDLHSTSVLSVDSSRENQGHHDSQDHSSDCSHRVLH